MVQLDDGAGLAAYKVTRLLQKLSQAFSLVCKGFFGYLCARGLVKRQIKLFANGDDCRDQQSTKSHRFLNAVLGELRAKSIERSSQNLYAQINDGFRNARPIHQSSFAGIQHHHRG